MKTMTLNTMAKALLLILVGTLTVSSLASPCFAQAPAVTFSQIMIPAPYDRCTSHITAAFGEYGYAVQQSGDGWALAFKGNHSAVMVCGLMQGRNTQLTIFVAGPNPDEEKNRLQAEMQRRFHR
ncbi:MAG: hypothetical protein ABSB88_21565 [Bryobacteraceae bacterium]|jgi:hypothetical protein